MYFQWELVSNTRDFFFPLTPEYLIPKLFYHLAAEYLFITAMCFRASHQEISIFLWALCKSVPFSYVSMKETEME